MNVTQNGYTMNVPVLDEQTLYASALVTINDKGYTKHYFEEGKRICSKIGSGGFNDLDILVEQMEMDYNWQFAVQKDGLHKAFDECFGVSPEIKTKDIFEVIKPYSGQVNPDEPVFYYHSDHLGSASYITDDQGYETQHLVYLPFGEDWVDWKYNTSQFDTPYKFNGKEKDPETGLHYYGARYLNTDLSIWLSVDPMSDKYPHLTSYNYCANNPVMLVDPDGRDIDVVENTTKDGKREVTINFSASIVNKSSEKYSDKKMNKIANKMEKSIESFYNGSYGDDVSVKVNADINVSKSESDVESSRHTISIVDNLESGAPANADVGGRNMNVSSRALNFGNAETLSTHRYGNTGLTNMGGSSFQRTIAHEFGHLGGLFDNNNMPSLMMQSVNIPNSPLKGDNYKRINVNQLNSVIDYVKGGKAWKGR